MIGVYFPWIWHLPFAKIPIDMEKGQPINMETQELFSKAMEKAGSLAALAQRLNYKERTLSRVLSGEIPMSRALALSLERAVAGGYSIHQPLAPVRIRESGAGVDVPLLSWAQAGTFTDFQEIPRSWEKRMVTDCPDENAFAISIRGDSMEPKFSEGDIAVVMPSRKPWLGALVVARDINDGVVFKLLTMDGETVQLSSYNPAYPMIRLPEDKFAWIYPVFSVTKYFNR